jgi:hypothetical protein
MDGRGHPDAIFWVALGLALGVVVLAAGLGPRGDDEVRLGSGPENPPQDKVALSQAAVAPRPSNGAQPAPVDSAPTKPAPTEPVPSPSESAPAPTPGTPALAPAPSSSGLAPAPEPAPAPSGGPAPEPAPAPAPQPAPTPEDPARGDSPR